MAVTLGPKQHVDNTVKSDGASASRTPAADELKASSNVALRLLSIPVRGIEKLGAAVIDWIDAPEDELAWMHNTRFPSDKIRQECIDGYWEERERAARAQKK